jgi:hypothetical protein
VLGSRALRACGTGDQRSHKQEREDDDTSGYRQAALIHRSPGSLAPIPDAIHCPPISQLDKRSVQALECAARESVELRGLCMIIIGKGTAGVIVLEILNRMISDSGSARRRRACLTLIAEPASRLPRVANRIWPRLACAGPIAVRIPSQMQTTWIGFCTTCLSCRWAGVALSSLDALDGYAEISQAGRISLRHHPPEPVAFPHRPCAGSGRAARSSRVIPTGGRAERRWCRSSFGELVLGTAVILAAGPLVRADGGCARCRGLS